MEKKHALLLRSCTNCLHKQEDVPEDVAKTLLEAAPGLFVRKPNGKLGVTRARDHENLLEKVCRCAS